MADRTNGLAPRPSLPHWIHLGRRLFRKIECPGPLPILRTPRPAARASSSDWTLVAKPLLDRLPCDRLQLGRGHRAVQHHEAPGLGRGELEEPLADPDVER